MFQSKIVQQRKSVQLLRNELNPAQLEEPFSICRPWPPHDCQTGSIIYQGFSFQGTRASQPFIRSFQIHTYAHYQKYARQIPAVFRSQCLGFPCSSAGKESTCNAGRPGFDPWVGMIPWRREGLSTPVFWPREFHGLYSPWGRKESDTTEQLSLHFTSLFLLPDKLLSTP